MPIISRSRFKRDMVPQVLIDLPNWTDWRQIIDAKGKPSKPPIDANLPFREPRPPYASPSDPTTWAPFEVAYAHWEKNLRGGEALSGLGFALDPENGVVGIDLDNCGDKKTGTIEPWALAILERFPSYREWSPSRKGIRIFLKGKLPTGGRKQGNIEVYDSSKVLTVTGDRLTYDGAPVDVVDCSEELLRWHAEVFGSLSTKKEKWTNGNGNDGTHTPINESRLRELFSAKPKAEAIYRGELNGYASPSEAEMALANYAKHAGWRDRREMCALLQQARINGGGQEKPLAYFERTVEKALEGVNKVNDLISSMVPEMGQAAYHGLAGDFLTAVAPRTEASKPCILGQFLAAVGARIGPRIHKWGGDSQPARINVGVVGPTSTGRKGTGFVPVRQLMEKADPLFWSGQPVKGLSSGEGLIAKLDEGGDKRLLVVEPEFSKVLSQTKREGNILSQIIREAYDSGDFGVLTRNPLVVKGAHVCVIGHITPEELLRRLDLVEMANGFANRFLWFSVSMSQCLPNAEPIPAADIAKFATWLKEVFAFCDGLERGKKFRIGMDEGAKARWEKEYPNLVADRPGIVGALTARGSSQVLRLSLLYALLDKKSAVEVPHLEAALAVFAYSRESVQRLFREKKGDTLADKLYELLGNGPLQTREFYRHVASKGVDINGALEQMETNGLVVREEIKTGKPGRPALRWSRA